jgi:O-antigen/teichoic acid export membrane protein
VARAFDRATRSVTLPEAVGPRQDVSATPWRQPSAPRPQQFRWFTPALALLLGGYLFFNKSFAYLHVPGTPVFVGEIVLAIGIVEVLRVRSPWYHLLQSSPILKALLAFMAVCALRLVNDLPRYQVDAVRDSSIWYYGIFAFLVAAAAVREPTFVPRMLRWYRRVLPWFFMWAPIAVALTQVDALASIYVPGTSTPINLFRPNDFAIHAGIGLAFLWLGVDRMVGARPAGSRDALVSVVGLLALLAAGSQNRGGFLAAICTLAVPLACLPSGRRRRIALSCTCGLLVVLALALALDLRIEGNRRDLSVQQLGANLSSLTGDQSSEDLTGTVEWRQGFWPQVLDDLLSSQAWLTGLGFGEILPERYEVDVGNTNSDTSAAPLRSVHNSHLTVLARVGFPGFGLWLLLWLIWAVHLFRWIRRRPEGVRDPATAGRVWLLAAVPAFLIGAYFDPSLEGPHVAIWLFTLVGLGAAATRVPRRAAAVAEPAGAGATAPPRQQVAPQAAILVRVHHLVGRLGWGMADRAVSSLINLAVGLYVARSLGVQEFGAFSMAFATYLILLAVSRGLASDALAVRFSVSDAASWRRAVAGATGTAVVVGLVAGAGTVLASLLLPGSTGAALLGLGITLPGLLLQDSWRSAFYAGGNRAQALTNDLVWALALVPAMAVPVLTGHATVGWVMLAWGGSATFAAAVGVFQARLVPRVSKAAQWLRRHRDLTPRYLGERLSLSGASQLRLYGLAVIAGLAAAGSLRAAELLLGPLILIIMGIAIMAVPAAASVLRRSSTRRLRRFCVLLGLLGAGGALLWGTALLLLPDSIGVQILRSAWLPASQLLLPVTLAVAGFGFSVGAWAGVRALGAASRSLRAQGIGSVVYLAGALGGAGLGGAAGTAWGSAAGTVIAAGVCWWELHQAIGEAEATET